MKSNSNRSPGRRYSSTKKSKTQKEKALSVANKPTRTPRRKKLFFGLLSCVMAFNFTQNAEGKQFSFNSKMNIAKAAPGEVKVEAKKEKPASSVAVKTVKSAWRHPYIVSTIVFLGISYAKPLGDFAVKHSQEIKTTIERMKIVGDFASAMKEFFP